MLDKCSLTSLFPGHDPLSVMIDSRSKKNFAKILANKEQVTLNLEIFKTFPVLERQILTSVSSWIPSLHKLGEKILFAISDGKSISHDSSYGKKKNDGTVTLTDEFVSLFISLASSPSQTRLTIFVKRNGFDCVSLADDMR